LIDREIASLEKRLMTIMPEAQRGVLAQRLFDLKVRRRAVPIAVPSLEHPPGTVVRLWTPEGERSVKKTEPEVKRTQAANTLSDRHDHQSGEHKLAPNEEQSQASRIPIQPEPQKQCSDKSAATGPCKKQSGEAQQAEQIPAEKQPQKLRTPQLVVLLLAAAWISFVLLGKPEPSASTHLRALLYCLPALLFGGISYWWLGINPSGRRKQWARLLILLGVAVWLTLAELSVAAECCSDFSFPGIDDNRSSRSAAQDDAITRGVPPGSFRWHLALVAKSE
jgi:hypothetical protein